MPKFSSRSKTELGTCHQDLQDLFNEVIKYFDCTIIDGIRGEKEQNKYFEAGKSTKKYPRSKHNANPSLAVDVIPYPVDWKDEKRALFFAGFVKGIAEKMHIQIRLGADWDGDTDLNDQTLFDVWHFELRR